MTHPELTLTERGAFQTQPPRYMVVAALSRIYRARGYSSFTQLFEFLKENHFPSWTLFITFLLTAAFRYRRGCA